MQAAPVLRLVPALYVAAAVLVVSPLIDFVPGVLPLRLGQPEWRFGALGLLSGFVLTPMLGVLIAAVVAAHQGHSITSRVLGLASVLIALLLLIALGMFLLDSLQVRAAVPEEMKEAIAGTMFRSTGKLAIGALAFGLLGYAAWRAASSMPVSRGDRERAGVPLMSSKGA